MPAPGGPAGAALPPCSRVRAAGRLDQVLPLTFDQRASHAVEPKTRRAQCGCAAGAGRTTRRAGAGTICFPMRRRLLTTVCATLSASVLAVAGRTAGEPEPRPRLAACFAPGTPASYRAEVEAGLAARQGGGFRFFTAARWSFTATDGFTGGQGTPVTLTWGIVPDGTNVPAGGFGGGAAGSDLRAFLTGIYGSESQWIAHFEQVFRRWGEVSGVKYVRETADDGVPLNSAAGSRGVRPDIRIGGRAIDGDYGVLAYNSYPDDGDMVIDTTDAWFRAGNVGPRTLRNVVAHENGHGLGLDHVCPVRATKLMEPSVSTSFEGPQHDDILGVQRLYGDPREPNDTVAAATDLGVVGPAKVTVDLVSVDGSGDTDCFAFTAAEGANADITLRPFGKQYDHGAQGGGGNCGTPVRIDTTARADLRLALLRADGTTIASADETTTGGTESLLDVPLDRGAGRYVVRVRSGGANDVQMYSLEVRAVQRGAKPAAAPDTDTTWQVLPVTTDVLANDAGLGDEPLKLRVVTKPLLGRAIVDGLRIVYVPRHGTVGDDRYVYEAEDVHTQRSQAEVTVTVNASGRAGNARTDADGDGYPDEFEAWRGTDANDVASRPGEDIAAGAPPLVLSRVVLRVRSHRADADEILLRGKLPLEGGFEPAGTPFVVSVAGVARELTLDAKGRATDAAGGSFRLQPRRRRGAIVAGGARFDLVLRRGAFAAEWADEGLATGRRQRSEPRAATVIVLLGGRTYVTTAPLTWGAVPGRTGASRLARL